MFGSELTAFFKPHHPHHHLYCISTKHAIMGCNYYQAIDVGADSEQKLIGKHLQDIYASSDAANFIKNNEKILETGIGRIFRESATLENGKVIIYTSHKMPLRNEKGEIIGIMGMSVPAEDENRNTDLDLLSPQQLKCCRLLIRGCSIKKIASELSLSHRTVEHYLENSRVKLKCRTTKELIARYAAKAKLEIC